MKKFLNQRHCEPGRNAGAAIDYSHQRPGWVRLRSALLAMTRPTLTILGFILILLGLSGCGFHLRGAQTAPLALENLYLDAPQTDDSFKTELLALFSSMHINLVKNETHAPYILHVAKVRFTHNNPSISSNSQAVSYNYALSVTLTLYNAQGKLLSQRTFKDTQQLSTNLTQLHTPETVDVMQKQLQHEIITQIYYWLTSKEISDATQLQST